LKALLGDRNGDVSLGLASYNAGPATVDRYNGIPPYPETQDYVTLVSQMHEALKPPPLPPVKVAAPAPKRVTIDKPGVTK